MSGTWKKAQKPILRTRGVRGDHLKGDALDGGAKFEAA